MDRGVSDSRSVPNKRLISNIVEWSVLQDKMSPGHVSLLLVLTSHRLGSGAGLGRGPCLGRKQKVSQME